MGEPMIWFVVGAVAAVSAAVLLLTPASLEAFPLPPKVRGVPVKHMALGDVHTELAEHGINPKSAGPDIAGILWKFEGKPFRFIDADPRLVLFVARLSMFLREHGFVSVATAGVWRSPHEAGRAIDLVSFTMSSGRTLGVWKDWGAKPKRPPFRLDASTFEGDFFSWLYEFAATEMTDHAMDPERDKLPPSRIGESSYVLSPDHPDPKQAHDHRDHVHVQIGAT